MSIKYAKRMEYIKGSAIRELLKLTEQPEIISFAGGLPAPELFPIEEMKEVCLKVLDTDGKAALQYSTTEGYLPLRKIISERMKYSGIEIPADDILITSGSQQGLEFSGKVFLDEGDTVICESPSYLGALNAFKSYLPRFVEVEMDNEGMKMDELEKALEANPNAKFIYTIPDFQNPSGITMSFERRKRLVELSVKYNVPIVEDNPYGDLRFEGERIPAVKHFDTAGMVIYLGTFSKTFSPGLRVGWVAASPEIVRKYVLVKQGADLQCNSMAQRETAAFVQMFDIDKHINKIIEVYGRRRTLMIETMEKEFPRNVKFTYPNGGLFTWVELPEGVDAAEVLKKALEEKVAFVPGGSFYPNGGNENHFRLNYSCMPEDKIVEGITRLGKVLKTL
ncbi:aminotransferase-like domain-containing protein [Lutispora sp.]|uniref:aminotransferase-like domain-containing protein n=1 Tax=Lutispora sp. TaxID=2828727 RepID=UPI002B2031B8|nr:PLP-dependent aminotransferase family protein [Lutispora sp.]MEA4960280.1 PLP-dependent aminotransferase family protein [Lutispora sp.]